ncbi:MAG TPA: iron-sulfur cluster assembly accessory protein [Candidatus Omnitrophica bacterium]|nr:iron-sulfur cluster assembly accessory protein [Candidatus Omnitrophota bacterium]
MSNQIFVTPSAVSEVKRMIASKPEDQGKGLRLAVKGGGCSGLSYDMKFDEKKPGDQEYNFEGLLVFIDPKSSLYLAGTTFDYSDTLKDKGFKFKNPNASKTCGCGESFSV